MLIRICLDVGQEEWFGMKVVPETRELLPFGAGKEGGGKTTGGREQNAEGWEEKAEGWGQGRKGKEKAEGWGQGMKGEEKAEGWRQGRKGEEKAAGWGQGMKGEEKAEEGGTKSRYYGLIQALMKLFDHREKRTEKEYQKAKEQERICLLQERQEVLNKVEEDIQKLLSDIQGMIGSWEGCFCVYEDGVYRALEGRKNDNCIETGNVMETYIQDGSGMKEACKQDGSRMKEEAGMQDGSGMKEEVCMQKWSGMREESCMRKWSSMREESCMRKWSRMKEETCKQDGSGMKEEACIQERIGMREETYIKERMGSKEKAPMGMEAILSVLWKKYFRVQEFDDYTRQLWVEELLPEAVLSHFVILGTVSCLPILIEKYADRMKSLRWILPENDYSRELQEFVEDFYTEYGLAIMLQVVPAGQRRLQAVCKEPSNVLDFTQEAYINLAKVAKGSIWLDMLSVEEKKRRIVGRSTGITYVSLKEKWKLVRKKKPFVPEM